MARTTIDIDPAVLRELRRRGRLEHKSMGQVASEVLARSLAEAPTSPRAPFRWRTGDLGQPHVDLEDKEALRALLDAPS